MATNYITLSNITFVPTGGDTPDTNYIQKITITVSTKTPDGQWTNVDVPLDAFQLTLNTTPINSVNNYNIEASTTELGNYLITFKGALPKASDYLVATADNGTDIFNRLFVDFVVYFDENGIGEITNFPVKEPGQYRFILNNVDGITVNVPSKHAYNFIYAPSKENSSITPLNISPVIPTIIPEGGFNVKLQITLKDKDNNSITGNNQISVFSQLLLPAPPSKKLLPSGDVSSESIK